MKINNEKTELLVITKGQDSVSKKLDGENV